MEHMVCKANHNIYGRFSVGVSWASSPVLPLAIHPGRHSCSRKAHLYTVGGHQDRGAARDSAL